MNILSIGNSFSQDAQRYLHQIARADKVVLNTFNLYIGGCSLSYHYRNMLSNSKAYTLEMNGVSTQFKVSIKEALLSQDWDVITLQQVSTKSPDYKSYQPYLNKLVEYVKECVPKAKIVLHQVWAYMQDSNALCDVLGYIDHKDMFDDIETAYNEAAKDVNADYIIPSGELFQRMLDAGVNRVHRDTHASYGLGRYALGLLWYAKLTGNGVIDNTFSDFDEDISEREIEIAKRCVEDIIK